MILKSNKVEIHMKRYNECIEKSEEEEPDEIIKQVTTSVFFDCQSERTRL
jgi:hypothetical protein